MKRAFTNCTILDGTEHMTPKSGMSVLTEDGIISDIVPDSEIPSGFEIIDLEKRYLLPGLINLHVHLAGSGKPKKKPSDPVKLVKLITANKLMRAIGRKMVAGYAKTQLLSGVTTIRTVGGIADFDTYTRDKINAGELTGPRILASNMAISVKGGHMAGSLAYIASSPKEAADLVDVIAKDKPDLIKLMITGGVLDAEKVGEPGVLRMPPEFVKAACDRAHELGFKVAAHVESPEGVRVALENGVDSIEHGAAPSEEIIELFKKHNAFQVSTISPAVPFALFDLSLSHATVEQHKNGLIVYAGITQLARECIANGIPVGLGTDTACPFITQYDMWREVDYFAKCCSVSPEFALYSATLLNARLAGVGDVTGSIEKGKYAEMIAMTPNPLRNLRFLRYIDMVIMRDNIIRSPKPKRIRSVDYILDNWVGLPPRAYDELDHTK